MSVKKHFYFIGAFLLLAFLGLGRGLPFAEAAKKETLPAVYFYDAKGEKKTLEDFKGKVILVNLWATWCAPCVAEMPSLDRLQGMFPKEKFEIVAISLDRGEIKKVADFYQQQKIKNLALYHDQDREIQLRWSYSGIPTSFLLDAEGYLIEKFEGEREWDQPPELDLIKKRL